MKGSDTTIGVGQTTTIEVNGDTPFLWVLHDVEARLKSLSARRANSRRHLIPVFHLSYAKEGQLMPLAKIPCCRRPFAASDAGERRVLSSEESR